MENPKRYWCFSCNKECKIIKVIEDGDEVYQCSTCKNAFVEEMEDNNKQTPSQNQQTSQNLQTPSQNQQTQPQNLQNQSRTRINITINNNNINVNNIRTNNTYARNNQNNRGQYQYGMNNTLLFLPSTVNYVVMNTDNFIPSMMDSIGSIFTNLTPAFNTILNSLNMNNGLISFLNNHNNDFQFNNLVNILMSFDVGSNRHPPASDKAIKELKKIEINENNLNDYKNITCNICLENFEIGNILRILECNHEFHENCIITWLKSNNTCPICRHELESNDPNYERRKNNHRENLRNLHRHNNNNNNNNGGGNSGMFV